MATETATKAPHVIIVGSGFGGLAAIRSLRNAPVRVTVIDRTNHHLFQPLLYQVAMAGLSPADIAYPIRSILRQQGNAEVLLEEVTEINLDKREILTNVSRLNYDYLILAAGAQSTYYAHPEWADFAVGMKDLDDALELRRRVLLAFEEAERERDGERRKLLLTFVIIGGGPTGVELAGSLAELARYALVKDFRHINPSSARIILLEGHDRILPPFVEELSADAARRLAAMGVEIRTGVKVTDVDNFGVHIGEELISSRTVMWCAGVAPSPVTKSLGAGLDRAGRVIVEPDLSIAGHPEAFAIGDICSFVHDGNKPLPGLAPVAMQQGQAAARSILDDLRGRARTSFHFADHGTLATVGRSAAVADFGRIRLRGFIAWLTWLFVHILFLIGFRSRLIVMFTWIWSYLTYERGARLITGHRFRAGSPALRAKFTKSIDISNMALVAERAERAATSTELDKP